MRCRIDQDKETRCGAVWLVRHGSACSCGHLRRDLSACEEITALNDETRNDAAERSVIKSPDGGEVEKISDGFRRTFGIQLYLDRSRLRFKPNTFSGNGLNVGFIERFGSGRLAARCGSC